MKHRSISMSKIVDGLTDLWKGASSDESTILRAALLQKKKNTVKLILNRIDKKKIDWECGVAPSIIHMMVDLQLMEEIYELREYLSIDCLEYLTTFIPQLKSIVKEQILRLLVEKDEPLMLVKVIKNNITFIDSILTTDSILFKNAMEGHAKNVIKFLYNLGLIVPDYMFFKQRRLQQNIYDFLIELTCVDIIYLMKHYKNIFELTDSYNNNLLHYAVLDNNIEFVDCLLTNGYRNVNHKNLWFLTPLHEAVRMENHSLANILRVHGAFLQNVRDSDQSVIGKRQDFFRKLEQIMKFIPILFSNQEFLFQLFHSQTFNSHLYCCSLHYSAFTLKDFHESISKVIFERNYTFLFKDQLFCYENCHSKSQSEFFLSPLCKDHDIRHVYTLPFIQGHTFLGYFMVWSKNSINSLCLSTFSKFVHHFMRSEYCHCMSLFPSNLSYLLELELCQESISNHLKNICSPHSSSFIPSIHFFIPILSILPESLHPLVGIFTTLKKCHTPISTLSSDICKLLHNLEIISHDVIATPSLSFLYQEMKLSIPKKNWANIPDLDFYWGENEPCLLKSFDIYEMTGNHKDVSYIKKLNELNQLISFPAQWDNNPKILWESVICLLGSVSSPNYRKQAVIGTVNKTSYRIFLPYDEILVALDDLFSIQEPKIIQLFVYYNWLLEWIHPLEDTNGRCVRFFLTIYMRAFGIPIIIDSDQKILSWNTFLKKVAHAIQLLEDIKSGIVSPVLSTYYPKLMKHSTF